MESSKEKVRILLVDDHPILRYGVRRLIESDSALEVMAEAESANAALDIIRKDPPDFAIIDISLKGTNGIELIKIILTQLGTLPILVLSMHQESVYAVRALRAGAKGYVRKEDATEKLISGIHHILDGHLVMNDRVSDKLMVSMVNNGDRKNIRSGIDSLTDRELEVFELLGEGCGRAMIAQTMNVSIKTIETYKENLKKKLLMDGSQALLKSAIKWHSLSNSSSFEPSSG